MVEEYILELASRCIDQSALEAFRCHREEQGRRSTHVESHPRHDKLRFDLRQHERGQDRSLQHISFRRKNTSTRSDTNEEDRKGPILQSFQRVAELQERQRDSQSDGDVREQPRVLVICIPESNYQVRLGGRFRWFGTHRAVFVLDRTVRNWNMKEVAYSVG